MNNQKPLDFKEYPQLEKVKSVINELELREWDIFSSSHNEKDFVEKTHQILTKDLLVFPLAFNVFSGEIPLPFKFFRARPANSIKNRLLRCEYSYPPLAFTKTFRANFQGFPVFYAADDPLTAIIEILDKNATDEELVGKQYCVSRWKLFDTRQIRFAPFLFDNVHKSNPYTVFCEDILQRIKKLHKNDLTESQLQGLEEIYKFLSRSFVNDKTYGFSSYLAHRYIYRNLRDLSVDLFVYPSIRSDRRTVNFAIHPNFADEKIYLSRVYLIEIVEVVRENKIIEGIRFRIPEYGVMNGANNIVNWSSRDKNNGRFRAILKDDFGETVQNELLE